jgi:hypothetical protein
MADLTRTRNPRHRTAVGLAAAGGVGLLLCGCSAVGLTVGQAADSAPPSPSVTRGQDALDRTATKVATQVSSPVDRVQAALGALAVRRQDTDLSALSDDVQNLVDAAATDDNRLDRPKDRDAAPWPQVCDAATTALTARDMDTFTTAAKKIPPMIDRAYPSSVRTDTTDHAAVTQALVIASLRAHSSQLVVDLTDPDADNATLHATITLLFTQAQACWA